MPLGGSWATCGVLSPMGGGHKLPGGGCGGGQDTPFGGLNVALGWEMGSKYSMGTPKMSPALGGGV